MLSAGKAHLATLLVLGWFASAEALCAQAPFPSGKDVRLRADFINKVIAEELEIVKEYDEHTKDPPELREDAHKLLIIAARTDLGLPTPGVSNESVNKLGTDLLARGSRDPLVITAWLLALGEFDDRYRVKELCDQAAKDVVTTYGPRRQIQVFIWCETIRLRMYIAFSRERKVFTRFDANLIHDAFARWIASDTQSLDRQRRMWHTISCYYFAAQAYRGSQLAVVAEKSKEVKLHPWMRHMLNAFQLRIEAKQVEFMRRDSDPIRKKEGKEFFEAWKLAPQFPEAACEMLLLSLGGYVEGSPRLWLDRTIAAEFDHTTAYTRHRMVLRREGAEALIKFGAEAAATRRYDTSVPFELLECLWAVENSSGEDAWVREGVYEMVRRPLPGGAQGAGLRRPTAERFHAPRDRGHANRDRRPGKTLRGDFGALGSNRFAKPSAGRKDISREDAAGFIEGHGRRGQPGWETRRRGGQSAVHHERPANGRSRHRKG